MKLAGFAADIVQFVSEYGVFEKLDGDDRPRLRHVHGDERSATDEAEVICRAGGNAVIQVRTVYRTDWESVESGGAV